MPSKPLLWSVAFVAMLLFCAAGATAQTRFQGGIGLLGGVPLGDFGANATEGAGGVLGHFDAALADSILSLGGEISYLQYGDESRKVALGALVPEIPDASLTVNTTNAMVVLHARLRAQRRAGKWRPYVDGLGGFTDMLTSSSIPGAAICTGGFLSGGICIQSTLASGTNSRDLVASYGGGAGVMIRFTASPTAPRLDISGRYIRGGEARYLTEGAIHRDANGATLDFSRSRTDMFTLYIGVAFGR